LVLGALGVQAGLQQYAHLGCPLQVPLLQMLLLPLMPLQQHQQ
jgi:hypothetical protein